MITLKEFVRDTLDQIIEATNEFAEKHKDSGASANPNIFLPDGSSLSDTDWTGGVAKGFGIIIPVEFDVAVTEGEAEKADVSGGIKVLEVVRAGGGLQAETENSTVSRVKFKVPLKLSNLAKGEDQF